MNKDEIINHFFKEGCTCDDGSLIPLRNCNKIRSLYEKDLKNVDCCDFLQQKVFEVYSHRLKIFLDIEEIKGGRNSH
jgi:hypothetical protein